MVEDQVMLPTGPLLADGGGGGDDAIIIIIDAEGRVDMDVDVGIG